MRACMRVSVSSLGLFYLCVRFVFVVSAVFCVLVVVVYHISCMVYIRDTLSDAETWLRLLVVGASSPAKCRNRFLAL